MQRVQKLSMSQTARPLVAKLPSIRSAPNRAPVVRRALELDFSDPDTQLGVAGAVFGLLVGIGVPIFYISRDELDEKRLEELRQLNRETKNSTGEYMSEEEIFAIRPPRWTDRREFVDDD